MCHLASAACTRTTDLDLQPGPTRDPGPPLRAVPAHAVVETVGAFHPIPAPTIYAPVPGLSTSVSLALAAIPSVPGPPVVEVVAGTGVARDALSSFVPRHLQHYMQVAGSIHIKTFEIQGYSRHFKAI